MTPTTLQEILDNYATLECGTVITFPNHFDWFVVDGSGGLITHYSSYKPIPCPTTALRLAGHTLQSGENPKLDWHYIALAEEYLQVALRTARGTSQTTRYAYQLSRTVTGFMQTRSLLLLTNPE